MKEGWDILRFKYILYNAFYSYAKDVIGKDSDEHDVNDTDNNGDVNISNRNANSVNKFAIIMIFNVIHGNGCDDTGVNKNTSIVMMIIIFIMIMIMIIGYIS